MPVITLPDGSTKTFDGPVTGAEVAADIGPGLAKAALCIRVDGDLLDLTRVIDDDAKIEIITSNDEDEALDILRHDAAHVLAEAVKELYPETQVTIGPNVENGFYYDFARDEPFTPEDLEKIEARMHEIVDRAEDITREVWDRDKAVAFFESEGEKYKAEIIRDLPENEDIRVYRQGAFLDLCRGPHLPSTAKLGHAFKLMSLAGAYWRGDSRNAMLQRIYGTAWRNEKELKAYLHRLEEAETRDHRRLGRELSLFHLQEEAVGSVFWHPRGWIMYREVEQYMRRRLDAADYQEVKTPQLIDRKLWEASGHWEKFRENMFTADDEHDRVLALKPMNCPGHVQIFRQGLKSYRDLPLRLAEFGSCHRSEPSGALHGLMRVRQFTQDDAHIFCAEDQINPETVAFCTLLQTVYRDFGFEDVKVLFADRPPVRTGDDAVWDRAEGGAANSRRYNRPRLGNEPWRGRLLWAKARIPSDRRDRPLLAMRHAPGRFRAAGATRCVLYRRRRRQTSAGHAASGDSRQLRALYGDSDRTSCGPDAVVAGAGAGGRRDDYRSGRRGRAIGGRSSGSGWTQGRTGPAQ